MKDLSTQDPAKECEDLASANTCQTSYTTTFASELVTIKARCLYDFAKEKCELNESAIYVCRMPRPVGGTRFRSPVACFHILPVVRFGARFKSE
eukprot:2509581-Pleurochrysis_carterae.AAC.3